MQIIGFKNYILLSVINFFIIPRISEKDKIW